MQAASLVAPGELVVDEYPVPDIGPGQVLVAMHHASICGSDVHVVFDGFHRADQLGRPGYPGHEGVGLVAASTDPALPVGTPVLTVPHGQRGGCFAEYQAVDTTQVIALGAGADLGRMLLAQQLGTTIFALKRFLPPDAKPPRQALVIGAGSAGLFFLQLLAARGVSVIVSDLHPGRLEHARRLGATQTVLEPKESAVAVALEVSAGRGLELVVEAAGYDQTRANAVDAVRQGGTVGCYGYPERPGLAPFPVQQAFSRAVSVHWVSGTQSEPGLASFRSAIGLIAAERIAVDHCLEAVYDLSEAPTAMAAARAYGHGAPKVGISMPAARS